MTKKQIEYLVENSYQEVFLDEKKVKDIIKYLNRKELKTYIKALKNKEKKLSVIITLSNPPIKKEKDLFEGLFPNKKIIYNTDRSLILGARIVDGDFVYEMSLKNTFKNLLSYITTAYNEQ